MSTETGVIQRLRVTPSYLLSGPLGPYVGWRSTTLTCVDVTWSTRHCTDERSELSCFLHHYLSAMYIEHPSSSVSSFGCVPQDQGSPSASIIEPAPAWLTTKSALVISSCNVGLNRYHRQSRAAFSRVIQGQRQARRRTLP